METINWNFWAFAASAVYAIVAFFQLRAISEQGDLTRQSLAATNRATDAANRNATAAFEAAEAATQSVELLRGQTEAAKLAAGIAATSLEHSVRPWIRVTRSISLKSMDAGDISFDLRLQLKNVGNSAAQYVRVIAGVIPWRPNLDQGAEETRAFNDLDLQPSRMDVVLPTDRLSRKVVVRLRWDELEAAWQANGIDTPIEDREIRLIVIGAIRYTHGQSITNLKLPSGISHHTLFHGEIICRQKGVNTVIPMTTNFKQKWPYGFTFSIDPVPEWRSYAD